MKKRWQDFFVLAAFFISPQAVCISPFIVKLKVNDLYQKFLKFKSNPYI